MVLVKVNEGILEGEVVENVLGGKYYSFKGIPYAEPPVGDLRFQAPKPPKSWNGTRSAKEHGPICKQFDIYSQSILPGSEDCLYLNVYTKEIKPSKPLPVMFWIHGGAFTMGSGNDIIFKSDLLVDKDVIVVTINYRLEVLGFLCLDIEEAPGNAGMKDQVAALRWVNKNIHNFGGDPNNITIFGNSAGGCSVAYHLISPMSKGLFKKAIAQSGVTNAYWATAKEHIERAKALARQLGKNTDDVKELLQFLKAQPVDALINTKVDVTFAESRPSLDFYWSIVYEKEFQSNERFYHGNCRDVLKNGIHDNIDVMLGCTADEGIIFTIMDKVEDKIEKCNNYLESFVPTSIAWNIPISKQMAVGKKIREYYYGKNSVTIDNLEPLGRFTAMNMFDFPIVQWAKAVQRNTKVYLYHFNCFSERNTMAKALKLNELIPNKNFVLHTDEILYLFINTIFGPPSRFDNKSESNKMVENITKLWTNFAKYGNPTPDNSLGVKWPPYTLDKQEYLEINEPLVSKSSLKKQEIEFWESIYKEYLPEECAFEK